jgi:hypothetical protein
MPRIAQRMILSLFGHESDAHNETAPRWAGRLEERIVSEVQANRETMIEALAALSADWAARALPEGNDDEAPDGTGDRPPRSSARRPGPAT